MAKIFKIDIESKDDFAKAFQFVIQANKNIIKFDKWQQNNVQILSNFKPLNYQYENYQNENKKAIAFCEKNYKNFTTLDDCHEQLFSNDDLIYFRVSINNYNDIVILHYYFLMYKEINNKSFMGIIVCKDDNTNFVTERMISSFLICEKENFKKQHVPYTIVKDGTRTNNKFKVRLLPTYTEKIFFLRKHNQKKYFLPCEIDDKNINVSRNFFPLLRIKGSETYLTLAARAKDIFGKSIFETPRDKLFFNDLLYKLATYDSSITWDDKRQIEELCSKNKILHLKTDMFLTEVLKSYAQNCLKSICQGLTKEQKKEIKTYIESSIEETSVLAICIFLSFLNYIKIQGEEFELDSLLMDAEDYADGLLQLIENVIKHAENGYFCFRIHKADSSDNIHEKYLKKYNVDFGNSKYYLEALVSDYNSNYDIPNKFVENLKRDIQNEVSNREYNISNRLIDKIKENFVLADLFNYNNNEETKQIWKEFYKESKNLTSHYGLLIFERIVNFAQGAFNVESSSNFELDTKSSYRSNLQDVIEPNKAHIPGTQYEILLPVGVSHKVEDTGLNYTLKFGHANNYWNCFWVSNDAFRRELSSYDKSKSKVLYRPYYKNKCISEIFNTIQRESLAIKSDKEQVIVCFDVESIVLPIHAEIIAKAFIEILCADCMSGIKYFAFKNASNQFMNTFIRIFSLLYIKSSQNQIMEDRQVYICSKVGQKEILFYGKYLFESLFASKNITLLGKGEPTREFRFLERQAEKAEENNQQENKILHPLPFEVIVDGVFEERVKADLETNIQKSEFGCCLHDVHMRVGTKIHMHGNYYEASLLFSNSNYVSRFAFYIYEKLLKLFKESDNPKEIVLIGYEAYSESLMIELTDALRSNPTACSSSIDYMIYYENNREQPFARWNQVKKNENTKFIIIVPIGSTLTTHDKIVADLCRQKSDGKNYSIDAIIGHFSVVLIRNNKTKKNLNGCKKIEDIFWDSVVEDKSKNENYVIYKSNKIGANNKIFFFISVENEWQLPNECEYCFPSIKDLTSEEPLIQANRSSVIPMTMYGIEDDTPKHIALPTYDEDVARLSPLKAGLCYGHVIRNKKNHYKYYFKTDEVMESVLSEQRDDFKKWLDDKVSKLCDCSRNTKMVFNFIVAPLHKTNAQFVHKINSVINAKQIVWLDTTREYRDNVKAKYSNLTALVKNLTTNSNEDDVHIHFHFVDDTITSGFTINRSKDLLKSLFYDVMKEKSNVKIHLFSSVVLLLNRCSENTKQNYVSSDRFKSYINLNVSVMRSHSDACVPCKMYNEYNEVLKKGAATNILSKLANEYAQNFQVIDESELQSSKKNQNKNEGCEVSNIKNEDSFNQLIATHRLNTIFNSLGGKKNNPNIVEESILKELETICKIFEVDKLQFDLVFNRVTSLLKVISNPFLIYRHSVNRATTKIMLELYSYILLKSSSFFNNRKTKSFKEFLDFMVATKKEVCKDFILILVSCLSSINSTILIRPTTINAFWTFFEKEGFNDKNLCNEYALCVKKLMDLSGRENLSSWIEKKIFEDYEPFSDVREKTHFLFSKEVIRLLKLIKIENTLPIRMALEECNKAYKYSGNNEGGVANCNDIKLLEIVEETLKQYFCKSYRDLVDIKIDNENFKKHCRQVFLPMLKLYNYLLEDNNVDDKPYYNHFLTLVENILETKDVIVMIETNSNINRLYPDKLSSKNNVVKDEIERYVVENLHKTNIEWIGDTFTLIKKEEDGIGILKLVYTSNKENNRKVPCWYIVFSIKSYDMIQEQNLLSRVRNLLAVRWNMVERLNYDFNNNIIEEFINYKDQFKKLGTDKSGSHTPYTELSDAFYGIRNKIFEFKDDKQLHVVANQYKLIADSIISKWYVHSVLGSFPENMALEEIYLDYPKKLSLYKDVLLVAKSASANNGGTDVHCSNKFDWDIPWDDISFTAPYHCDFMWCAAFQSLIFNALHHGYNYQNNDGIRVVDISLTYRDDSLIIRNRMRNGDVIATDSVTLKALKYFFDSYYGNGSFEYKKIDENEETYFEATIPCKRKE